MSIVTKPRPPIAFGLAAAALTVAVPALAAPVQGSGVAWDIVEGLTTEIGPRPAGSSAEDRARDWGAQKLKSLGFQKVAVEEFKTRAWTRGPESAALTAPYAQPLAITALGFSVPTPKGGLKAELVYFPTLAALEAAPDGSLKGKVAFIDHAMRAAQDGSGYGPYGNVRRQGPTIASRKGAAGVVIRSAGTDSHRNPHTGVTTFAKDVTPIPSGAVSNPDADLIARTAARGKPMAIDLTLMGKPFPDATSGNVVAELPGRDPSLPIIVVACHLDSWDLGTGAVDDASGCAIVTAAALAANKDGQALRTIRVLWSGNEEMGLSGGGGEHYVKLHGREPHALAMESDFGADKVWQVKFDTAPTDKALADKVKAALWPMGIVPHEGAADGGEDVSAIIKAQSLAVIDLGQDGMHYFDLHHTPDDTLDKVDPLALQQNVDAWAAVLKVVANEAGPIGKATVKAE
ncbi:M20/M25/M40 family metallo-hydrolase [Novosphingobium sp. P6W]|uniref:M20/M25/M40 family metallo-hydrolase n=1 Tax=Novosphingobium sp. P6W TaxID=1609758 RepID=UPI0005C2E00B|nr:M20/M25/M40 family metallo-hydrolase [Novosphingobium sp. P6W]AXB76472.1 peptidase M28 family protein [Novosphingobium sp. P6W]KIS32028.1 peptidase M28 [Novosphingobium sp. P6W]